MAEVTFETSASQDAAIASLLEAENRIRASKEMEVLDASTFVDKLMEQFFNTLERDAARLAMQSRVNLLQAVDAETLAKVDALLSAE